MMMLKESSCVRYRCKSSRLGAGLRPRRWRGDTLNTTSIYIQFTTKYGEFWMARQLS